MRTPTELVAARPGQSPAPEGAPAPGRRPGSVAPGPSGVPRPVAAAVGVALAAGVALRFVATSELWLDEALTVHVARLPLAEIPGALRRDGAPPLYYVLLHAWVGLFGEGNLAVRSLSGAFGVAALPPVWALGRRLGGRGVAWAATLLLATSPFAVRFSTEARMYSLVTLLGALGGLVLHEGLRRPRPLPLAGVAAATAALLYAHYWSLYLVAVVGGALAWRAVRRGPRAGPARAALAAVAVGVVAFVPWLPTLAYQVARTGTPWSERPSFTAMVGAIAEFAGGADSAGRALALAFFALAGLGLFGRALDACRVELDLRTRPEGRAPAAVFAATLALAIAAGMATSSAFAARYASVVLVPFLLLVALGTRSLADFRVRWGALGLAAVLGLWGGVVNAGTQRTQAGEVAAAVAARSAPGDVVAYCPDQLGPSVSRLLPAAAEAGMAQLTYPDGAPPERVDWVDYEERHARADPAAFASSLHERAGTGDVWLVWYPEYRTLEGACESLTEALKALRPGAAEVVPADDGYFEKAVLHRYPGR